MIDMKHHAFLYSFKIWLVAGLMAPIPFLFDLFRNTKGMDYFFLGSHPTLVYIGLIFSILPWLIFWSIIELFVRVTHNNFVRKTLISTTGLLLTAGTFYCFMQFWGLQPKGYVLITILTTSCIVVSGSWIFKLKSNSKPAPSTNFITPPSQ